MASNLKENLLDGYNIQSNAPKAQQESKNPPLAEGESYTISDKPTEIVVALFTALSRLEFFNSRVIGKAYMLVTAVILTVLLWVKQMFLTNLPGLEVLFVLGLVTFIFNYYLINGALYKPFLDNESHSMLIKVTGAYAVGAIATFFYALEFMEMQSVLAIFFTSFGLVILAQSLIFKQSFQQKELYYAIGAFVGTLITILSSSGVAWSQDKIAEPNSTYGFGLSVLSAIFMTLIMINFEKMNDENYATLNHIFSMIVVLFVPIFFPIQGVITPTLGQWVILVISGIFMAFATLFFIRSCQLEIGGRSSVLLFLQPALYLLIEVIAGEGSGFLAFVGALATIGCAGMFAKLSDSREVVPENQRENGRELDVYSY